MSLDDENKKTVEDARDENADVETADTETTDIENTVTETTDDETANIEAAVPDADDTNTTDSPRVEYEVPPAMESKDTHPADARNPIAKKAAAIYITIILALVAVVVVMAVIFFSEAFGNEDSSPTPTPIPTQAAGDETPGNDDADVPDDDSDVDGADDADGSGAVDDPLASLAWNENKDYGVTTTLGEYLGLPGVLTFAKVTESDIDAEIESFLDSLSTQESVTDRTDVRDGDLTDINFVGRIDGVEFEGGSAENYQLEIGSNTFIDGMEEKIIGMNIGETADLDLQFPDPYQNNPDLAGKDVVFTVTVNDILVKVTPELTDELVAENTDYSTIAEYRTTIGEDLALQRRSDAQDNMQYDVLQTIINGCTFEGDIDSEINDYTEYYIAYYDQMYNSYYGMDGATLFSYFYGFTSDEYYEYMYSDASNSIKYRHVLDAVVEDQGLTVTDEEFDAYFEETFFDGYGYTSREEVYAENEQADVDDFVNTSVLRDKAEKLIVDSIVVTEEITDGEPEAE